MKKGCVCYKAQYLYTREYGRADYEAWLDREKEINGLMRDCRNFGVPQIVHLREESFRMMKNGERQHDLNLDAIGNILLRGFEAGVSTVRHAA